MYKYKKEYIELVEKRNKIIKELKLFEQEEIVKKHMQLVEENKDLYDKQLSLYRLMKEEEYNSCKHVLVYSRIDYDRYEGRSYEYSGCIKCGLDNSVLDSNKGSFSFDEEIMYSSLRKQYLTGTHTKILCDLALAQAIYSKIKQAHPNIDDETAIDYFTVALNDIRNIKVSDDRKVKRAKRLSLNSNFRRWTGQDVQHD